MRHYEWPQRVPITPLSDARRRQSTSEGMNHAIIGRIQRALRQVLEPLEHQMRDAMALLILMDNEHLLKSVVTHLFVSLTLQFQLARTANQASTRRLHEHQIEPLLIAKVSSDEEIRRDRIHLGDLNQHTRGSPSTRRDKT